MSSGDATIWDYIDFWANKAVSYKAGSEDEKGFAVEKATADKLQQILRQICDDASVFPFIAPGGEGDITAVWYAGEYSLSICVWNDCEATISLGGTEMPAHPYTLDSTGHQAVKNHLALLSSHVKTSNPKWRELIPPMI